MNTLIDVSILGLISLMTSTLAGVFGLGGGMLLVAILPLFLPSAAIIPLHGVTQLASNSSRALFSAHHIIWRSLPGFLFGSLLGIGAFGYVFLAIPSAGIPMLIGGYIIASQWSHSFNRILRRYEYFFVLGFLQTGLGLVVGATGPLTTALLSKKSRQKDQIVATNALFMCISHGAKILFLGWMGFAYLDYVWHLVFMVFGAMLGSWLGTYCRSLISSVRFVWLLKWLLTGLAIIMIIKELLNLVDLGA